ncbi:MAG: divergent polysaccharide deacetylase family protein [Spirochaetaceae bacterium]|nr:divergent polysaccharide deacetylase family protein [Spirochaetaceae bacterium]
MPKKKRKQLSNKQILMITLCILGAGMLMLVASILLAPSAEPSPATSGGNAVVAQSGQNSQGGASAQSGQASVSGSGSSGAAQKPTTVVVTPQAEKPAAQQSTTSSSQQKPAESPSSSGSTSQSSSGSSASQKPQASSNSSAGTGNSAHSAASNSGSAASGSGSAGKTGADSTSSQSTTTSASASYSATAPATSTTSTKPKSSGGKLVFVFDDAGHNLNQLEPFLKLPFKVVIAVLPGLPHSAEAAAAARKAGKQVILHQPMQAVNLSVDPGPSAIKPDMHTYEIEALVRKNLAEIGPVVGLNNHEGSLITATQSAIGAVLDVCKAENIFFLDSRTNAETKAPQAALERGMKIYERDIFLDNEPGRDDIIAMIKKGLAVADKKGHAIMIGHIWSDGLAAIISEMYPDLVAQGYVFTDISGLN